VFAAAVTSEPVAYGPEIPEELAQLCNDATAPAPRDRLASVASFRERLAGFLRRRPAHALTLDAEDALARAEEIRTDAAETRALRRTTLADAKLGFTRALVQWPESQRAARGLERARVAMVRHALAAEDAPAARALYTELAAPDPALDAEVASLEARARADRERGARWASVESELDTSGASRERTLLFGSMAAAIVLLTVILASLDPTGRPQPCRRSSSARPSSRSSRSSACTSSARVRSRHEEADASPPRSSPSASRPASRASRACSSV
jgi:hypothetical protein